jgi:hypothetical protein
MTAAVRRLLAWLLPNSVAKSGKEGLSWIKEDAVVAEKGFRTGMTFFVPFVKEISAINRRDGLGLRLLP